MGKKKIKIDANLIIAFGVLLASVGALIVSTRQASIMNEQTKIILEQSKSSAWPSLSIGMSRRVDKDRVSEFLFSISNRGTGPAIVEQTYISYNGNYFSNWSEFYEILEVPDSMVISHRNDILLNRVIKPGEDFILIDWSKNIPLMNFIFEKADAFEIIICCKSVYGDYWQVRRKGMKNNLERNITIKLDHCKNLGGTVFQE
ncbi:hypothetical protein SAMN04489761_2927 [Tenacibaculum sp. MAR_2009_124]|uniref:hypothetical protein n=1 Tax=Tenacibaculum sp. MAR_2009_124 TaxID=1250059 RepID=UPI000898E062|nr:hypothetical protein [Tenacibaculum sp. MAR_2009_124]SEC41425.1 hypothetical protein SAMN04489761_2927 [Tenacibaculum sp. MAR_2009_124]